MKVSFDQKSLPEWTWDGAIGSINEEIELKIDHIFARTKISASCDCCTRFYPDSEPESEISGFYAVVEDIEFYGRDGDLLSCSDAECESICNEIVKFLKSELT